MTELCGKVLIDKPSLQFPALTMRQIASATSTRLYPDAHSAFACEPAIAPESLEVCKRPDVLKEVLVKLRPWLLQVPYLSETTEPLQPRSTPTAREKLDCPPVRQSLG